MWGERLDLYVGIYGSGRSSGGPRAVVRGIREAIVVALLRTVISGGCVAVCPGMDSIGGARGGGIVEGWGRIYRGGGVGVARVDGTIS